MVQGAWVNPKVEIEEVLNQHNLSWNHIGWVGIPGDRYMTVREFQIELAEYNRDRIGINPRLVIVGSDWFMKREYDTYLGNYIWRFIGVPTFPPNHPADRSYIYERVGY